MGAPQKDTEAKTPAKAKRKMPTEAERIANLEAQLAAAKEKAAAKNQKRIDVLLEKQTKIQAKVVEASSELIAIGLQLDELGFVAQPADAGNVTELSKKTGS